MIYNIDPKTDFVAKILLGHKDRTEITEDFLNSILSRQDPYRIHSINLLNPFNDKETEDDKLSVVDVKCQDSEGTLYQIEIQLWVHSHLPSRMLHTLADIFQAQLGEGQDYEALATTQGIWLLNENLFPLSVTRRYHHHFQFCDKKDGLLLSPKMSIDVIELQKWQARQITDSKSRWLYFFLYGAKLDDENLPEGLRDPIMERAMQVLKTVHDKKEYYEWYHSRREQALEEATNKRKLKEAQEFLLKAEEKVSQAEEKVSQAEEKASQAEEKASQAEEKASQAEEKASQAEEKVSQAEEKASQAEEKASQAEEKASQAEEKTSQAEEALAVKTERLQRLEQYLKESGVDPHEV